MGELDRELLNSMKFSASNSVGRVLAPADPGRFAAIPNLDEARNA
jgi:hypothetical protein